VKFKQVYDPVFYREYLFNLRVVGLWIRREYWKEGFCYQEIILNGESFRFIYTDLGQFRPFFFTKRKAMAYLEEIFSFVPSQDRLIDFSHLGQVFKKPVCKWLGFPYEEKKQMDGVFFITPKGKTLFFPKEQGKKITGELTFTLMLPLPPYAYFFL